MENAKQLSKKIDLFEMVHGIRPNQIILGADIRGSIINEYDLIYHQPDGKETFEGIEVITDWKEKDRMSVELVE